MIYEIKVAQEAAYSLENEARLSKNSLLTQTADINQIPLL